MPKKKNTKSAEMRDASKTAVLPGRFSAADLFVYLVCGTGIALCLWLFYADLNRTLTRLNHTPIAEISFKYGSAQRRFIDRMVWDRVRETSPVYDGDLIRTADLSHAVIRFADDDAEINLLENSIIQIFPGRIDFTQGNIQFSAVNTGKGIVISSGNKTIDVSAGSVVSLAAGETGNLNVQVVEGSARINTAQGVEEAAAGSAVLVDSAGSSIRQSQAVALSPPPGVRYLVREAAPVRFRWNPVNYAAGEKTRIEIAEDRSFRRLLLTQDTEAQELTAALEEGSWWWRVYPAGSSLAGSDFSAASKIDVIRSLPPLPLSPAEGEVFRYKEKTAQLRFAWTAAAEAQAYIVEIAPAGDFAGAAEFRVQGTSFTHAAEAGTWYWRVRPIFGGTYQGSVAASPAVQFAVEKTDTLAPPLPLLADGSILSPAEENGALYFSWKRENEAASYAVRISKDPALQDPLVNAATADNYFVYKPGDEIPEGVYYWGLSYTDAGGTASSVSVQSIVVRHVSRQPMPEPESAPEIAAPEPAEPPEPVPAPEPAAPLPEIVPVVSVTEIVPVPESVPAVEPVPVSVPPETAPAPVPVVPEPVSVPEPRPVTPEPAPKPPGDPEIVPASAASPKPDTFPAPSGLQPSGRRYGPADLMQIEKIGLSWNSVEGADAYIVIVYHAGERGRQELFRSGPLKENSFSVELARLDIGRFEWQVEAVKTDSRGNTERSTPGTAAFTIDIELPEKPGLYEAGKLYGD